MLVSEHMTRQLVTIKETASVPDALKRMRDNRVRRLPVLNDAGKLVGIVSEKDLLYASPSPATTLSIYEMQYLLSKISVQEVMTPKVVTVCSPCPIEQAAHMMVDHKIGGLPVVDDDQLVGIITETDIFKAFLELLGARQSGVRMTLLVPEIKGILAKVTGAIADAGGNIISLGTLLGEDPEYRQITVKVADVERDTLIQAMEATGVQITDVRVV